MTFLNPLVLIGLAAASIPLILHLLNLRKPRTIEFSTLAFLKELQQTSIRRLKLRQILLLILRTALIVCIVLAFARPALRGSILGTIGSHAHTSVILLLDDTFSMSAGDERGNLFRQAKEKAVQLLDFLKEGDEAGWLRFSDLPNATMETMTHNFDELKSAVDETEATAASGSLENALRLSAKLLATSRNANKEVYILSDMQRTAVQGLGDTPSEHIFAPETKMFLLQFGSRETDNVAVDSVSVLSRIFEVGKPVTISARVYNYGKNPLSNYVASAYLSHPGEHSGAIARVAQRNLDVPPWSSAVTDFTIIPQKSGFLSGYISIEEDALELDNKRWFSIYIPAKISVAFVSPSRDDVRFVSLSLTARSTENWSTLFSVQHITPQQFSMLDLTQVDVLVLSNVPGFSQNDAEGIQTFVEQGGGLIIFPGDAVDEANYGVTLFQSLKIPPFEGKNNVPESSGDAGFLFEKIDTDHPLFQGMFESGEKQRPSSLNPTEVESPRVAKRMKRQAGKQGRTIVSLNDQTPFLTEYRVGDGVALVFSSAPVLSWSDFPLKGLFAPLIHRSVLYASTRSESGLSTVVGDAPTVKLKHTAKSRSRSPKADRFTLVSPGGDQQGHATKNVGDEIIQQQVHSTAAGSFVTFSLRKLTEPGVYEIRNNQQVVTKISVNVSPLESDLRDASSEELEQLFSTVGIDPSRVVYVAPDQNLNEVVLQSRYGVELWKMFLVAALVVALMEMAVARESSQLANPKNERPIPEPAENAS